MGGNLWARQGESPVLPFTPIVVHDGHDTTLESSISGVSTPPTWCYTSATLHDSSYPFASLHNQHHMRLLHTAARLSVTLSGHSLCVLTLRKYYCSNDTQTFSPQWCWSLINQLIFQSQLISTQTLSPKYHKQPLSQLSRGSLFASETSAKVSVSAFLSVFLYSKQPLEGPISSEHIG